MFSHIVKIKRTIIGKSDTALENIIKIRQSIFEFEGQSAQSKNYFLLKTTGLKLISTQEKIIFATGCSNDTFLVKTIPMKLYFMFPLEVPKIDLVNFRTYDPEIKYVQHDKK